MIALIASALLGLYVFVPYIVFHRVCSVFLRLKKFQRTKTDEIVFGVIVTGLPFLLALLLFWNGAIGCRLVPFCLADSHAQKSTDYQRVFSAAYSEGYFEKHEAESWQAFYRVSKRQADFLVWNYSFLILESLVFVLLVSHYGEWKGNRLYSRLASRVLLPAVSEWHVLLTTFNFPTRQNRSVEVDALSKDNILYRGTVVDHFLGVNGELSGLLFTGAQRFQYEKLKEDRKSGVFKNNELYWRPIPGGGNFYLPGDNIASLNVRYPLPKNAYERLIKDMVEKLFKNLKDIQVSAIVPKPSTSESDEPQSK